MYSGFSITASIRKHLLVPKLPDHNKEHDVRRWPSVSLLYHRIQGLTTFLLPSTLPSNTLFGSLSSSILAIWPKHLSLWEIMKSNISSCTVVSRNSLLDSLFNLLSSIYYFRKPVVPALTALFKSRIHFHS